MLINLLSLYNKIINSVRLINTASPTTRFGLLVMLVFMHTFLIAQKKVKPVPPLLVDKQGRLQYTADSLGDRIPDFSYAGYMGGDQAIPDAPIKVVVPVTSGDATLRIQSALDYVASLPTNSNGLRGAVLLQKGNYEIAGALKINASGVVLRGSGMGDDGTILFGAGKSRETLISIAGKNDRKLSAVIKVADVYVPVNATELKLESTSSLKVGDGIIITRPSTQKWIDLLGTDHFGGGVTALGWKPGQRDISWDRKIVAINGNSIVLDAPITTALDTTYGGATVSKYEWPGRIAQVGVENLRCVSDYDTTNAKDEDHRWMAITIVNTSDAWVRRVKTEHFAGSAVAVWNTANRITIEDCKYLSPVSEIGGQRRNAFYTEGGQILFQRLYSEYAFHDFATGFCTPGPTAFVQCQSKLSYSFSGGVDSWASGLLFDVVNIDGDALSFMNRGQDGQGAGWAAANSMFYQCTAARIDCYQPPAAQNWAFGNWAQFAGDGYWAESNNSINPRSLYNAQLGQRLGIDVSARAQLMPVQSEASSSPSVAVAAELTAGSTKPAAQLSDWIDAVGQRSPIDVSVIGIKTIDGNSIKKPIVEFFPERMEVKNGLIVRGEKVMTGNRNDVPWWTGSSRPYALAKSKPHITRFVPGQVGTGLTDDLDELTDSMVAENVVGLDHNYGLWYERRRDDHERIRRMDGDVWPPFYELPFARSGQSSAWDGLSKYDLTKYNYYYWSRLHQFANLADEKELVLIHENYFQHNIIEAGAHYADYPWRTANNINGTPFPEPVPFAGDKRIFMAEQYYDVTNPAYRALHVAYIRKCLENFADNSCVIQLIGAEFTGPLHFVQFWLDTIAEWEKETGKNAIVGLSTTKDVQDSILADPIRSKIVDLIDIRYWHYQADGKTYEPKGGQNLAPRQHARLLKPKATSFEQVYRAVKEYRLNNPGKAVIYSGDNFDHQGWAAFMAGGSLANIPKLANSQLVKDASSMKPVDLPTTTTDQWILEGDKGFIIYVNGSSKTINLDLTKKPGSFKINWISAKDGKLLKKESVIKAGKQTEIKNEFSEPVVLWLSHK
jgi:hypothetical protein